MTSCQITVCTYKRNVELVKCLESIDNAIGKALAFFSTFTFNIVVVDNDDNCSAHDTVIGLHTKYSDVIYISEKNKGLVKARNRALASCASDFLVFIDDDEFVTEQWLVELIKLKNEFEANVLIGPVYPQYPDETNSIFIESGVFVRASYNNGEQIYKGGAGNCLLEMAFVRENNLIFDENFNASGGEDAKFFYDVSKSNGIIRWANNAVVYEPVSLNRLKIIYLLKRALRGGWSHYLIRVKPKGFIYKTAITFSSIIITLTLVIPIAIIFILKPPIGLKYLVRSVGRVGQITAIFKKSYELY